MATDREPSPLPRVRMRWSGARAMHASDPSQPQPQQLPLSVAPQPLPQQLFAERVSSNALGIARIVGNSVAFAARGAPVVERSFVFPDRVRDAVFTRFASDNHTQPHLCVLVRADCVNVYAPTGEVFEAALPFRASRLFAFGDAGLLLQRSIAPPVSTGRSRDSDGSGTLFADKELVPSSRPRFFTLAHPLDEVKPIALEAVDRGGGGAEDAAAVETSPPFVCDPGLETVAFCAAEALLVCYHTDERRFCVFRLQPAPADATPRVARTVRVVDAATWRKHRESDSGSGIETVDSVAILPDWIATPVWTSSPAAPVTRHRNRRDSANEKRAFVASDAALRTILCMVDKAAGVLVLKRVDSMLQDHRHGDNDSQRTEAALDDVTTIRCRDAVPIATKPASVYGAAWGSDHRATDIVVLTADGELRLHRGALPICFLLPPHAQDRSDARPWSPTVSIRTTSDDASSFEVCGHNVGGLAETLNTVEHPLRFEFSSLLESVFQVFEDVLPVPVCLELRAKVVAHHQEAHASSPTGDSDADVNGGSWSEWRVFCSFILKLLASEKPSVPALEVTQQQSLRHEGLETPTAEPSAFDRLCQSSFHRVYTTANPVLFAAMDDSPTHPPTRTSEPKTLPDPPVSELRLHAVAMFGGLHLLHEDLKLSVVSFKNRQTLAELLLDMATRLHLEAYSVYYQRETGQAPHKVTDSASETAVVFDSWDNALVPDILEWIQLKIQAFSSTQSVGTSTPTRRFPSLANTRWRRNATEHPSQRTEAATVLWRTGAVCRIYELLASSWQTPPSADPPTVDNLAELMAFLTHESLQSRLSLSDLPFGVYFPVVEAIREFRQAPPPFVTEDVCHFIGREDLAGLVPSRASRLQSPEAAHSLYGKAATELVYRDETQQRLHEASDGLEEMIQRSQSLFPADQRTKEVARLVRSSRPLCLKLEKSLDVSDQDFVQQQQARLLLLCKRSMSLSVARGMVTLGSFDMTLMQNHAWQLRIPALPLAGRTPPTNATVSLDVSSFAKELTYWPQFHNGCAAGLRLPPHDLSHVVNRYWIKYHRPSVAEHQARQAARSGTSQTPLTPEILKRGLEEAYAAHAGLLLGLGLRGHLKCLSMADVYNYLSLSNELVTVAVLLGMATTAAHCRQARKSQPQEVRTTSKSRASWGSTSSSSDSRTPEGVDGGVDTSLQDDDMFVAGSPSKAPLVGSGLELTLERSVSKMLCLHIPSLLPPPFADFSVPASTQTAALLGLGILYRGTGHRLMTELLLTEIARSPSSAQFVTNNSNSGLSTSSFDQLEGYALAAGLALGFVVLGCGQRKSGDPGLADMKLEEKLHKYITGGAQQFGDATAAGGCLYRGRKWQSFGAGIMSSSANSGGGSALNGNTGASREPRSQHDRSGGARGEHVNTGVTACGSALALAFMYMKTENKSVAAQLAVPDTLILLDSVRPDILLVRTLAKNLVLWDAVEPSTEWVEDVQVPKQLLKAYKALQRDPRSVAANRDSLGTVTASAQADARSICEAYANVVAGACFSIGFRFAGTGDGHARATLRKYVLHFREMRARTTSGITVGFGNVVIAATERATVERCLAVCAQALALVDAGSGNVETLALLRSINLRQRVEADLTFGNHMALSSAIGLLFLGGGRATLSQSNEAIAALVVALFPMYPMNTADNKYHLQAFRHLYVLAVDTSRLLETVDVNSGANCSVPVRLELRKSRHRHVVSSASDDSSDDTWHTLQSPCLLPDLGSIKRVLISSGDFYPVEILMSASWSTKTGSSPALGSSSPQQRTVTANAVRLELLRNRNMILLKRTKRNEHTEGLASISRELRALKRRSPTDRPALDRDDQLLEAFQLYFSRTPRRFISDSEASNIAASPFATWWDTHAWQLVTHIVREEASSFLPIHLNLLHVLFRLQQQHSSPATSLTGLRNLKLYTDYCDWRRSRPAFGHDDSGHVSQHAADFVVSLKLQTEQALRALWEMCSISVSSTADVRTLVRSAQSSSGASEEGVTLDVDARFVVSALVHYFLAPGLQIVGVGDSETTLGLVSEPSILARERPHAATLATDASQEDAKARWLQLEAFFLC